MDTPIKRCTKCGQEKPATLDYFPKRKPPKSKDGLDCWCLGCHKEKCRERRDAKRKTPIERPPNHLKRCIKCKQIKPRDTAHFPRRKQSFASMCHECHHAYYTEHKEHYSKTGKKRYYQNRDAQLERHKIYREKHKQELSEKNKIYRHTHPEKGRAAVMRRIARKKNAEGFYTDKDIELQYQRQKGKCYWCGKKVGKTYHVDHVKPLDRGGSNWPSNIVIACPHCNDSKGNKLPHEWRGSGGRLL